MGLSPNDERLKFPSGPELTPAKMVAALQRATGAWTYDVISMGYPGSVMQGKPAEEPRNLASGWVGFDYEQALGKPVRIVNDAAMQALGAYRGGRMLFLGLKLAWVRPLLWKGYCSRWNWLICRTATTAHSKIMWAFAGLNASERNVGDVM